jgi:hypothetical protein
LLTQVYKKLLDYCGQSHTVRPGIFSVGTFIPQPGEWSIAIAAQRHADYDLNYKFTAKVSNAPAPTSTVTSQKTTTAEKPSSSPNANIVIDMNNNMQEPMPKFDSFCMACNWPSDRSWTF